MKQKTRRILALAALLTLLLAACTAGPIELQNPSTGLAEEVYLAENDKFEGRDKEAVDEILAAFETALSTKDVAPLMQYVDESFTATEADLKDFFEGITEGDVTHTAYDWYYVRGLRDSATPVVVKKTAQEETSLRVIPASGELFVALYASETEAPIKTMLSLMCAKKGGKWSLVWIDISDWCLNGEDANALYVRAKAAYDEGKVLPAFLLAQMTANIATPGNILCYPNSDAIEEFVYQVIGEGLKDYPLPMELDNVGVTLRSVATSKTQDGVVPMFFYSTKTPLSDKKALAQEAKKVYNAIEAIFPGTTQEFPTAEFRMTNADPEVDENFDFETVVITMN
ncbi:MAG: hypothetical protein IJC88_06530 [Oscillospiraceae bacterium]|nr:hypothetical protein [Oscillospiraceae bacterium]